MNGESMNASELVQELHRRGVDLQHRDGRLVLVGPRGVVDESLQAALRERKQEILATLLENETAIAALDDLPADTHPLSIMQQSMWYLESEQPDPGIFNLHLTLRLRGALDVDALRASLCDLEARHDALRATVVEHDAVPVQRIVPAGRIELVAEPIRGGDENAMHAELTRELMKGFGAMHALPVRSRLFQLGERDHVLLLVIDHLVTDGTSLAILKRELLEFYAARVESREPRLQSLTMRYGDIARLEARWLETRAAQRQLTYWKKRLAGDLPALELPRDFPRPEFPSGRGEFLRLHLPRETVAAMETTARASRASGFMLLSATLAAMLSGLSGQREIVIGMPMANRDAHDDCGSSDGVVGLFMNPVPLRLSIERSAPFDDLLRQVRDRCFEALENQAMPFGRIVEAIRPPRGGRHTPIFQALVTLVPDPERTIQLAGLEIEPMNPQRGTSQLDVAFWCRETDDGMCVDMEYNTDVFSTRTAHRMLRTFERLLNATINDPAQSIAALPLLSETDRSKLADWGDGAYRDWSATTVDALVREQCARTPASIAVHSGNDQHDYAALGRSADTVRDGLRALGIGRGDIVGVLLERDVNLPAVLLGILETGAAYLPLDPEAPLERLQWMLEDANAAHVITHRVSEETRTAFGGRVVDLVSLLSREWQPHRPEDGQRETALATLNPTARTTLTTRLPNHTPDRSPDDPAYVIYTSGSTGKPKGVIVPHRAVANFLRAMRETLDVNATDRFLALTTLSFDIAVLELWLPLTLGARTDIIPRAIAHDGDALCARLAQHPPSVLQATPATWQMLLAAGWQGDSNLCAISGGEALPTPLARTLVKSCARVWNLYGPTETTVWSAAHRVSEHDDPVPIGKPIANTQLYVLDASGQPTPPGVPGELYIGGDGVTLGYLNRPELTRERFVPDPFLERDGALMYRTGDRVRFNANGDIEYLGRVDFQLKLRGYRIEPGEIEAVLETHPAIERSVVVVRDFGNAGGQGEDQRLVAYMTLHAGMRVAIDDLRNHLRAQLPAYMIPQHFVDLDAMPLTASGKIDRKALPSPTATARVEHVPPQTDTEQRIAAIWQEILGVERVSRNDNFFDIGGHSLSSMKAVARIDAVLGCRIRPRLLVLNSLCEIAASCDRQLQEAKNVDRNAQSRSSWKSVVSTLLGRT